MTIYADIRNALEKQLVNVTNGPGAGGIAWENYEFNPTTGTAWLRPTLSPTRGRPTDVSASGIKRYDGLFLVDVFAPQGDGPKKGDDLADAVVAAYPPGTPLTDNGVSVQIEWAEVSGSAVTDPPWYMVPVAVKWKSFN